MRCRRCGLGYCVRHFIGRGWFCPTCADELALSRVAASREPVTATSAPIGPEYDQ